MSQNDSACEPWVKELNLFQKDMNILRSKKEWINDDIINAAQHLLKDINPALSGFQSTACGLVLNFNSETREFVQILYGENHWNVISSIGVPHGSVEIFDSMYTKLSDAIKMQIANIVYTSNPHITILFQNVQQQSGSSDCGLFSIAFATALVYGKRPENYHFNQREMRSHLLKCFQQRNMELFPIIRERINIRGSSALSTDVIEVFCMCRMPELPGSEWIECTKCNEWYHMGTCVVVPPRYLEDRISWLCFKCRN